MSLCFAVKTLCDLSLYFLYARLICAVFGVQAPLFLPLAACVLCAGLSHAARARAAWVRLLPLVLLPLSFAAQPGLPLALVLLPCAAYLGVSAARRLFRIEYGECCEAFRRGLFALLPLVLMPLFGAPQDAQRDALTLAFLFLCSGVFLLRLLRHEPQTLSQPRFVIQNCILLALFALLVLFVSSDFALHAAVSALGFVYRNVIVPPLTLLGYVAAGLMWLLTQLFSLLRGDSEKNPPQDTELGLMDKPLFEQVEAAQPSELFRAIATTLVLIVIGLAVWRMLRRRLGLREKQEEGCDISVTREAADAFPAAPGSRFLRPRTPRMSVRATYRRFLALCLRVGIRPERSDTSGSLARKCAQSLPAQPLIDLRELYRAARYSEEEVTRDMAQQAHTALRDLKKHLPKDL